MTDFFVCDYCGSIDLLSLVLVTPAPPGGTLLCSGCLPVPQTSPWLKAGTGEWHGLFERKVYDKDEPLDLFLVNRPTGFSLD